MGFGVYPTGPVLKEGIVPRLLRECNNLYADISGYSGYNALRRDKRFSRKFLAEFSSRILFGTDNTSYGLGDLLGKFKLGEAALRNIMGENALLIVENKTSAAAKKLHEQIRYR